MRATRMTAMIPMKVREVKKSIPAFLSDDKVFETRHRHAAEPSTATAESRPPPGADSRKVLIVLPGGVAQCKSLIEQNAGFLTRDGHHFRSPQIPDPSSAGRQFGPRRLARTA